MTTETNQQDISGLAGAAAAMISGSAKNLGQLLGVPVDFRMLEIGDSRTHVPEVIEEGFHLSVDFTGALTGDSWFVLSTDDAKAIVKIMTQGMGVGEEDLLGELGMSALSEAMNQLMAGAATALSDGLGDRIDISPPRISTNPEPEEDEGDSVIVTYQGEIAGQAQSKVYWKIDRELAKTLAARWIDNTRPPEPAAAAQTTAPAAAPSAQAAPAAPVTPLGDGVLNTVELDIAVELGNVSMTIAELLRMGEGSVVTLNQSVGDNVVMLANGTPVASGEVVIVEGILGFRVADLITEAKGA